MTPCFCKALAKCVICIRIILVGNKTGIVHTVGKSDEDREETTNNETMPIQIY